MNVLLQSFRFSPSKKSGEIIWNLAAVRYPTIGKDSMKAELPLKVDVLKEYLSEKAAVINRVF